MSTCPSAARPSRRNRDSADECSRSGPSSASGSRKTVTAASNATPCFTALASAFRGSHSNTYSVYTECQGMLRATGQRRPSSMPHARSRARNKTPIRVLALPDLEHAKSAVLKGVRRLGVRLGNWLTPEQGRRLLEHPEPATLRQLRDHAMLAMLIGCGLRRGELLAPHDLRRPVRGSVTSRAVNSSRSSFSWALPPSRPRSGISDLSRSSGAP